MQDALDLHTFKPSEASDLVEEYLRAAQEAGLARVRIIHGKGTGRMKATVEAVLRRHPAVAAFAPAPAYLGGWGATVVELLPAGAARPPAGPPAVEAPAPPGSGRPSRAAALYERFGPALSIALGLAMTARMRTNYDQVRWLLAGLAAAAVLLVAARLRAAWSTPARGASRMLFANIGWFVVPFYLRSAAGEVYHLLSLAPLAATLFVWEWAPVRRRAEATRAGRMALRAATVFYLLNMALPTAAGLGLAPAWWLASAAAGGLFALAGPARPPAKAAAAVLLAGAAFAWRPWFPPVPMVVKGLAWEPAVAPRVAALPGQLTLHSTIFAPQGLREKLVHVWLHEGRETDRVALEVAGGRQEGFRTRSRKRHWPRDPAGAWRVELRTEDGRFLAAAGFRVGP